MLGNNVALASTCRCELIETRPWQAPTIAGETYLDCPVHTPPDPFLHHLISLYMHYKNGFLLKAGALEEQPAVYLEAMQFIGSRLNEIEYESLKKGNT